MFTESSGSMYEEIENQRKQLLRKRKIMKRRILVIISLGLFVLYLGLLLNDIRRFHKGDKPLITISYKVKEYDDGKVETYTSLGWIFRYYLRETINQNEIAPIWSPIKKDKELNRQVFDENLPEIETNYTVPDNMGKKEKDKGVLFFYDKDENLLGTYKCALSENDCEISYSGVQDEDKNVRPYNVKMSIFENRYVFITEYKNRYSTAQEKYVFLYDITAKHLIAGYQDVRYATYDTDDKNINHGYVDENRFIVMKNDKWGIDQVEKGRVSHFEEYQYYYINYDEETKLYIFETPKDNWGVNKWVAFDANKKYMSPAVTTILIIAAAILPVSGSRYEARSLCRGKVAYRDLLGHRDFFTVIRERGEGEIGKGEYRTTHDATEGIPVAGRKCHRGHGMLAVQLVERYPVLGSEPVFREIGSCFFHCHFRLPLFFAARLLRLVWTVIYQNADESQCEFSRGEAESSARSSSKAMRRAA